MVHIREDAAGSGEGNEHQHDEIEDDAESFGMDVARKGNHHHEENGGDDHSVGGRETRFAGAVWTGGEDDKSAEDNINSDH